MADRNSNSTESSPRSTKAKSFSARESHPSRVDFDQVVHERMRLGILSGLAVNKSMTFRELKQLLSISDGNLSVHARKLEIADYIVCAKSFEGRVPRTEYRITAAGRKALEEYLDQMERLIAFARKE